MDRERERERENRYGRAKSVQQQQQQQQQELRLGYIIVGQWDHVTDARWLTGWLAHTFFVGGTESSRVES